VSINRGEYFLQRLPGFPPVIEMLRPICLKSRINGIACMRIPNPSDAHGQTVFADDGSRSNTQTGHGTQFCCPIELPAKGPDLMTTPRCVQCAQYEQPTNIIGQYTNTEKYGNGLKLPTLHPLHSKTDLQLLDPVFAALPTLIVPRCSFFCRFVEMTVYL